MRDRGECSRLKSSLTSYWRHHESNDVGINFDNN